MKGKRLDAGWNNNYLLKILTFKDAFALLFFIRLYVMCGFYTIFAALKYVL
jgi:hypothetical protein